jgi:F-type H+-transporting ATPase subunit alpha
MEKGEDVLVVYDDLSKHAGLQTVVFAVKKAGGREAYPGDIFYLHSRLLERASDCLMQTEAERYGAAYNRNAGK